MDRKTFVIVDDSKVSRMMVRAIVEANFPQLTIIEADCGDDAIEKIAGLTGAIYIIDYNMPGMDGITLAGKVKSSQPDAYISMLTANIQEKTQEQARALNIGYISKPITEDKITSFINMAA